LSIRRAWTITWAAIGLVVIGTAMATLGAPSSYVPVNEEPFPTVVALMSAAKADVKHTDNLMQNLRAERFYKPQMINGLMASADGLIKTFPLRRVKDTPPYLHDGRLLTLDDTVKFFNLILGVELAPQEKKDLVAFVRAL
jgi:hypothetical protein